MAILVKALALMALVALAGALDGSCPADAKCHAEEIPNDAMKLLQLPGGVLGESDSVDLLQTREHVQDSALDSAKRALGTTNEGIETGASMINEAKAVQDLQKKNEALTAENARLREKLALVAGRNAAHDSARVEKAMQDLLNGNRDPAAALVKSAGSLYHKSKVVNPKGVVVYGRHGCGRTDLYVEKLGGASPINHVFKSVDDDADNREMWALAQHHGFSPSMLPIVWSCDKFQPMFTTYGQLEEGIVEARACAEGVSDDTAAAEEANQEGPNAGTEGAQDVEEADESGGAMVPEPACDHEDMVGNCAEIISAWGKQKFCGLYSDYCKRSCQC